jgi:chromosome segregation ATPase
LNYTQFISPLVKAVQEEDKKVEDLAVRCEMTQEQMAKIDVRVTELEKKVSTLESENKNLKNEIDSMKKRLDSIEKQLRVPASK